jgi:hypothetical protein
MSDDYLWDKSGEADPEIEELEQLLGNLRYRRPAVDLPLPKSKPVQRPRNFMPALAVAATVILAVAAAGAWFVLGIGSDVERAGISAVAARPGRAQDWLSPSSMSAVALATNETEESAESFVATTGSHADKPRRSLASKRKESMQGQLARSSTMKRREVIDYDEGVAAREQLIKALHLASSKLNRVQKKIQDNNSTGPVS